MQEVPWYNDLEIYLWTSYRFLAALGYFLATKLDDPVEAPWLTSEMRK